ncbi:MAG: endo-1,4-beta-xylanase [Lachnospiraceae bacterium]|nr:endo-1,4-beta-xylanase [Lachnospiraceae bacterium]
MKKFVYVLSILLILCLCSCTQEEDKVIDSIVSENNDGNSAETPELTMMPTSTPSPTATAAPTPTPSPTISATDYRRKYEENGEIPSLKERYSDLFMMGCGIVARDVKTEERAKLLLQNYNSLTCGNEMKADYTINYAKTVAAGEVVLSFASAKPILDFAKENGLKMRGHTLVWHSQVPRFFFTEGFSKDKDAPFVSREVMLERMESYIRQEMEYINTNYPGLIYAWDVVNEVIEVSDGHEKGLRTNSYWYQTIGDDYVIQAFRFARKYADPDQLLFYNDYNMYDWNKRQKAIALIKELQEENLIDGVGMQSHVTPSYPSVNDYQKAITEYANLGLQIHITELDVDAQKNDEQTQKQLAVRYKRIFAMYEKLVTEGIANITSVTIWGIDDATSWLNDSTPSWPMLFDKKLNYKLAYWGAMQDKTAPSY